MTLKPDATARSGFHLSLTQKICTAATLLAVLSLGVTAAFIGVKSGNSAEDATMALAHTSAREAVAQLQTRISSNLASVQALAASQRTSKEANIPLQRPQIDALVQGTLLSSPDFIGAAVTWEPNALDGADDDVLLAEMAAHPILLNRPIVVTDKGAKLCRPGELVEGLL